MKRKLIAVVCLAAIALSGCGKDENGSENVFQPESSLNSGTGVQSSSGSSSSALSSVQSSVTSSSAAVSTAHSSEGSSAVSSSVPPVSSAPVSSAEVSSSAPVSSVSTQTSSSSDEPIITPEPQPAETTYIYNHDPENACTITFDGKSITVTGKKGNAFSGVNDVYPSMKIERTEEGDTLTCVLTPKKSTFYQSTGMFYILSANGGASVINLKLSNSEGVSIPDLSSYAAANQHVTDSVIDASPSRIASYITMDGKLGKRAEEIWAEITKISNDICAGIEDDYEKLRAISRWTSDNIYYDYPAYSKGAPQYCLTLEYMLNNRTSICGGYATMTSALCAVQGIRCLNISGMAVVSGNCYPQGAQGGFHEWNIAEIDGRQIIVDSGWNSGNTFGYDGKYNAEKPIYRYFDIGAEIFALDHKAQNAEYRDYLSLFD